MTRQEEYEKDFPVLVTETKHFEELMYSVIAQQREYVVDFTVYEIAGVTPILCWVNWGGGTNDVVYEMDKATVFLSGGVRWDGCSNFHFDPNDDHVCLHFCGKKEATNLGRLFGEMYDWAKQLLNSTEDFE